jgi:DNA-binding transcriptional LysR family regulator
MNNIDGMMLPQGLDADLLRAFVLIADGLSFTQAAARVGRTQSAVSMQVKRLEELLGQPVLSRSKGGASNSRRTASTCWRARGRSWR